MIVFKILRRFAVLAAAAGLVGFAARPSTAQTAHVQLIHNSPDPALRWLDVYFGDALVADSLLFRIATEYMEVPSGLRVDVGLAPANSAGPQDIFKSIPIGIDTGKQYIVVIHGLLDPGLFKKNPDDLGTEVTVLVRETKEGVIVNGSSEYLFVNGVTDAPSLSFAAWQDVTLAENVAYGATSTYVPFNEFIYTMALAPTAAESRILGFFELDVGFLQNQSFTLLTSGFVNKFENNGGPELKLMIVASDGFFRTIELAPIPEEASTMQIINNSPDVEYLEGFDILFDGGRAVDDLLFQRATPTFGVPGDVNLQIELADSTGSQVFANSVLATEAGINYLVMINGLVASEDYAPNPGDRPTSLAMTINPNIRRGPDDLGVGEFIFSNGITDVANLDLEVTGTEPVEALPYGEMSDYRTLSDFEPLMEAFRQGSPLPPLASHVVEIPFIQGRSFVVYASGFDEPALNQNGSSAQLMLALQDGAIVQLKARELVLPFSRLQVIHASADPTLQVVDLYINQFNVSDDATYRSGTQFFDVFSGKTVTVGLAPASSTDFRDIQASTRFTFEPESSGSAFLRGVSDPGSFAPNPDGIETGLDVRLINDALETGPDASQFTVLVANAITDAPALDVVVDDRSVFATELSFSQASSYGLVEPRNHSFDFRDAIAGNRVAKSFVDFFGLRGRAGILVASGFVDSTGANQDGPRVSSFLVLDDGSVRQFDRIFTHIDGSPETVPGSLSLSGAFPNPFSTATKILFDLPEPATVSLDLFDVTGRVVGRVEPRLMAAGNDRSLHIVVPDLSSGIYMYRLKSTSAAGSRLAQGELLLVH